MQDKIYINERVGLVDGNYPGSTAYVKEDLYLSTCKALDIERDKNATLKAVIDDLRNKIKLMEETAHYHDQQQIIHRNQ